MKPVCGESGLTILLINNNSDEFHPTPAECIDVRACMCVEMKDTAVRATVAECQCVSDFNVSQCADSVTRRATQCDEYASSTRNHV